MFLPIRTLLHELCTTENVMFAISSASASLPFQYVLKHFLLLPRSNPKYLMLYATVTPPTLSISIPL